MVTVSKEPLVGLVELLVLVEPPLAQRPAGDQDRPRTARAREDGVLVIGMAEADGGSLKVLSVVLGKVGVPASDYESEESPRVVVHRTRVVMAEPVMDADRPEGKVDAPPDSVRALRQA